VLSSSFKWSQFFRARRLRAGRHCLLQPQLAGTRSKRPPATGLSAGETHRSDGRRARLPPGLQSGATHVPTSAESRVPNEFFKKRNWKMQIPKSCGSVLWKLQYPRLISSPSPRRLSSADHELAKSALRSWPTPETHTRERFHLCFLWHRSKRRDNLETTWMPPFPPSAKRQANLFTEEQGGWSFQQRLLIERYCNFF